MEIHLKKNEAAYITFPMVNTTNPDQFDTGETVTDTAYYKDGAGAWTTLAITDTVTEIGTTGVYSIDLTAAEMNHDLIMIKFTSTNAADTMVMIRCYAVDIDDIVRATTPANTLDVTATGAAGIDWGNVENAGTTVDLSATSINLVDTATSVTNGVTASTVSDKTGYSISGTITTLDGLNDFDPAIDTVANVTTTANVTNDVGVNEWNGVALGTTNPLPNAAAGAAGGLPTDSTGKTSFNDITAANVNAEVVDALTTDTYGEPGQGAPPASASIKDKLGYLYKFLRNKKYVTSTEMQVFADDTTTVDHKSAITGTASNYTEGEWASGP